MRKLSEIYNKLHSDSLYRNSIYLMISTGIMSVLGFFAWAIVSRLYPPEQVGLATTIISVTGIISSFSLLGLGTGLIRFLPNSERKNEKINTAFTLATLVTIVITTIFLLGLKGFSPNLLFIKQNMIYSFIFIIFMIFFTLNGLLDSIFIGYRSTGYVLMKNSISSILKLIFPIALVSFGAYGIFGSWALSVMVAFLISFMFLVFKFNYQPKFAFYDSIMQRIGVYSFSNYLAGFIGGLATLLIPLMITNLKHPELTAYYYISLMMVNVLFIIPSATTNSLFAEGSNNQKQMKSQIKKAVKITSILLFIGILGILFLGKPVLGVFGQGYAEFGYPFLTIMAFSAVFVTINSIYESILRVKKDVKTIIRFTFIRTLIILLGSYYAITQDYGLSGIAFSFIIGHFISSVIYSIRSKLISKK